MLPTKLKLKNQESLLPAMNLDKMNGVVFAHMVKAGAQNLESNKQVVNDLNVFPVPDGDTGDNMAMTILAVNNNPEIFRPAALSKTAGLIKSELLLGARGNSGVILSRIFAGIADGLGEKVEASVAEFSHALQCGVTEAYAAVAKPIEGTVLTVLKDGVRAAHDSLDEKTTFLTYFNILTEAMNASVERTPELLPALKSAGVVDSGGVGLFYIFSGMRDYLNGKTPSEQNEPTVAKPEAELDVSLFSADSELEFGYCTEFLLRLQNKKQKLSDFKLDDLITYLKTVGDSVVAFQDESIVKVHLHTKTPGKILSHCQQYGEFLKLKIENMTLQHHGAEIRNSFEAKPRQKYGVVTVASGKGMINMFEEMGCDVVIPGGQSMNPSTNDFVEAFKRINAEKILVFPNNKNIIMAAKQAAAVFEDAEVIVLETRSIGEGYAAISMLDTTAEVDEMIENAKVAAAAAKTGQVSLASRSTTLDGIEVVEGDYIGFADGKILCNHCERKNAVKNLCEKLNIENFDVIILAFGSNVDEVEAEEVLELINERCPRSEIFMIDGGQPIYDYLLILE